MIKTLLMLAMVGLSMTENVNAYTDVYAIYDTTLPEGNESTVFVKEYHYNIKGELLELEEYETTYGEYTGVEVEETEVYVSDEYLAEVEYNSLSNNW
ncbi:MAG: hypothetical protein LUI14_14460 [Lachnospiraceae bacterium]|nr:hypothetical protein [Lachnospiraceae bacterium]